jgi:hypothetical protein
LGDELLLSSAKSDNTLNILVATQCNHKNGIHLYIKKDISRKIMQKVLQYTDDNPNTTIKKKLGSGFQTVYPDSDFSSTSCQTELYDEYSKTDLFFIVHPIEDSSLLIELALSNVLIVTPSNYVNQQLAKALDMYVYTIDTTGNLNISWNAIKEKLVDFNIRDKLIDTGYTLSENGAIIRNYLMQHLNSTKSVSVLKPVERVVPQIAKSPAITKPKIDTNKLLNSIIHTVPNSINKEDVDRCFAIPKVADPKKTKRLCPKVMLQGNLRKVI